VILAAAVAVRANVSPVEQVISLLDNLQSQTESEGAAEAATYETFACFCRTKTNDKVASIDARETSKNSLSADKTDYTSTRAQLKQDIKELNQVLDAAENSLERATNFRNEENAAYEVKHADAAKAVHGVQGAITSITGTQSLAEKKAVVTKTMALARALNLVQVPGAPDTDYDFHGSDITKVLEDLEATFTQRKSSLEDDESVALSSFNQVADAKRTEIRTTKSTIDTKEDQLATAETDLATTDEALTEETALLADDNTYLKDLTGQCEAKAREWDQRSTLRGEELGAISQALTIIAGTVATTAHDSGAGGRHGVAPVTEDLQVSETDGGDDYTDIVFAQLKEVHAHGDQKRSKAIRLLKRMAKKIHSPMLELAAMKIAAKADPFAKVKTLIQKLIERLVSESNDQASQKGWCDTQIGTTNLERDYRHSDAKELTANIQVFEARREKLETKSARLTGEIADLDSAFTSASQTRGAEKAENKQTLDSAQEGLTALTNAINILQAFYKKGGKQHLDFVQTSASPVSQDMAGAGASHLGVYKGNQAQGGGILGMLATIKSDFERTIKQTTEDENQAHRAFVKFDRETKSSRKTKETGRKNTEGELMQTRGDLQQALESLERTQALLDAALETLEQLRPACVDTGMSYEERVARREAEIQALKDAVCVLDEEDRELPAGQCPGHTFLQK